jgi:F-type H+-transporting ATPase subunit delta
MSSEAIVQKYSQALFEISTQGKAGVLAFEIDAVSKLFGSEQTQDFFNSPFNSQDNKMVVAKASLEGQCMPEVFNYIVTLVQNDRIGLVAEINEAFQILVRNQSGETEGVLYSAAEPTEAFKAQVEQKLSESLKRKVTLRAQKDPSLLSGYKVTIGSWTIDDSAQFHINKLKEEISHKG